MDIKEIIENYKIKNKSDTTVSERADIVKKFVDKLNTSRKKNGFKELPARFYAVKMAQSGLKSNFDLYWFYKYCDETKNFDKTWWWSLKAK